MRAHLSSTRISNFRVVVVWPLFLFIIRKQVSNAHALCVSIDAERSRDRYGS